MNDAALGAVAIYAGISVAVLLWLTVATGRIRRNQRVSVGDGGNARLIRVMRGHANATETIPPTLIGLTLMALLGASASAIHLFGVPLVIGRLLHALHFTAADAPGWQRGIGFALTMLAMLGAAGWALVLGLGRAF